MSARTAMVGVAVTLANAAGGAAYAQGAGPAPAPARSPRASLPPIRDIRYMPILSQR